MIKKIFFGAVFMILIGFAVPRADAATFGLSAGGQSFSVGDNLSVDLRIDSQGVSINAAQGTVRFSPGMLEAVSIDRSQSVFNFWLQDPTIDNAAGTISFTGGSTSGFSGASLEIFRVDFLVKGVGSSSISVADGAVAASDGSGTNVLVGTRGIDITVGTNEDLPNEEIVVLPPVEQITRPATPAQNLPPAPEVSVGLYPNQEEWHNASAPFLARWLLPSDITDVATAINKNPSFNPSASEGLFDNKSFAALNDGIWYLHVRFRNSAGWGQTAHYRLAIDTAPPVPFSIVYSSGSSSTNPSPTASFGSKDPLSGIGGYSVQINNGNYLPLDDPSFVLPILAPGSHSIKAVAKDKAGNTTETVSELEVIPIESPTIVDLTRNVYIGEGGFEVSGTSVPGYSVIVALKDSSGIQVTAGTAPVDEAGEWFVKLNDPLKRGKYYAEVTAKDSRGASSLPVRSEEIRAYAKPIITIAGIGITPAILFVIIIIALVGAFVTGLITENGLNAKRQKRIFIAKRDITNVLNLTKKNIATAGSALERSSAEDISRAKYLLDKAGKNIEEMGRYLIEGVEEINNHRKGRR